MADQSIEQVVKKTQKLIKAYALLKTECSRLKKQLALAEMENARLHDKHQQANTKVESLINQLTLLEG